MTMAEVNEGTVMTRAAVRSAASTAVVIDGIYPIVAPRPTPKAGNLRLGNSLKKLVHIVVVSGIRPRGGE